jgi:peptidyl-prolyl cis-trans isomerase C
MNKTIKQVSVAGAAIGLALAVATGPSSAQDKATGTTAPAKAADLFPDTIVAKGENVVVKRSQVEDAYLTFKAASAARGQNIPEAARPVVEANLVTNLAVTQILVSRATPEDKATVKTNFASFLAQTRAQFTSEELFIQALTSRYGVTLEQFTNRGIEEMTREAVLQRVLKPTIKVADAEVRKFYDEHPAASEQPEQVRAAHILVSTLDKVTQAPLPPDQKKDKEALARKIRARAASGEDFGKLAKDFSEDPGSKDKGGEYTFPRGKMVPEFEAAAFSMQTNQVSDLVETKYGFHIIKLLQKIPAKKIEFDEVAPKVRDFLMYQAFQKAMPVYFETLLKEAKVEFIGIGPGAKP